MVSLRNIFTGSAVVMHNFDPSTQVDRGRKISEFELVTEQVPGQPEVNRKKLVSKTNKKKNPTDKNPKQNKNICIQLTLYRMCRLYMHTHTHICNKEIEAKI